MLWLFDPLAAAASSAGLADIQADLSITDSADSVTVAATAEVTAVFSKTDSADTFSATATNGPEASLSITDAADSLTFTGTMGEITAVFSKTDSADTLVFDATDGSSSGGLVFRAGVGRNFGGMFVIEPGTGTNEITPSAAGAIPVRFGRFSGGLIMLTGAADAPPGPPATTFVAGITETGIGFGGGNTANSTRTGFFSMIAGVGNLSTIDTTDRQAVQGEFGIGFGGGNTGRGIFVSSSAAAFGMGGANSVAIPSENSYSTGPSDSGIGFGGGNDNIFVTSSTESVADVQIGGENTIIATTAEYAALQLAISQVLIEGDETLRDALRLIRAATVGKGVHGSTVQYLSKDGSKVRVEADVTGGNRDVIVTDPS